MPIAPRLAVRLFSALCVVVFVVASIAAGQTLAPTDKPLPFDQGEQGLKQQLRKLQTTGRLLEITAHPDDEDGDVLAMMARGRGYHVTLLTITRGEGGQNRMGSALFDELGVLRTLELLESDKYYGVEQRFTRMADFGFSKSPQETIQKWGHDAALADIVRVIREVQPDIVVAKFAGDERDGHGHHQASAILAREAFRAAGDPSKFPEHFKEGLRPWQAKKFYMRGFPDDHTLAYDTNVVDPVIGISYAQLHIEGLKHQQSQLSGNFNIPPGPRMRYYKLVDSTLPNVKAGTKEKDFFEGLDVGYKAARLTWSADATTAVRGDIEKAVQASDSGDKGTMLAALQRAWATEVKQDQQPNKSEPNSNQSLIIADKIRQLETAMQCATGIGVRTTMEQVRADGRFTTVSPGQAFQVNIDPGNAVMAQVEVPSGWTVQRSSGNAPAHDVPGEAPNMSCSPSHGEDQCGFRITLPANAEITRQHWERDDPETDTRYRVTDPKYTSLPLPPLPLTIRYCFAVGKDATQMGCAHTTVPLIVVPPIAVTTVAATEVLPHTAHTANIGVDVRDTSTAASDATARVKLPPGWNAHPSSEALHFGKPDDKHDVTFHVTAPQQQSTGMLHLTAIADHAGKQYSDGFEIVTRDDLGAFPYFAPARERISVVDVKVPQGLKVGYIMGAGDDIPTVLKQVGMDVTEIAPQDLASADLSKYGTIVLGIRVYDTQDAVRKNNERLLEYVKNGGTLVVQYNSDVNAFNSGHYTPYSFDLSRDRVSQEEQPVQILSPNDPLLKFPNAITEHDFDGWVQERGLYFADNWDDHFQPLLACNDPGEPSRKGGLLRAKYGKGTYIYTGYAFFRQLPAGVPGAVRLFVNLVSAGHETAMATAR